MTLSTVRTTSGTTACSTAGTTMVGNAIEGLLQSPGQTGQGAVLAIMLLIVLLIPMVYYVISTARASREYA